MGLSVSNDSTKRSGYAWRAALVGLLFGLFAAGAAAQDFSISDVTAAEDAAALTFTITLTGASGTYSYDVDYATDDGTATVTDSDYTADSGTLTFSDTGANTTTATVTVVTGADALDEADETLTLTLSNATAGATVSTADTVGNASLNDSVATGTITNDDVPAISFADVAIDVIEGVGGATLTITLDKLSTQSVSVQVDTVDGTAENALGDYDPITAQLVTIAAGQSSTTIALTVNDDTLDEPDETFFVNLSAATGGVGGTPTISTASATVTITNDDVPSISIGDLVVSET